MHCVERAGIESSVREEPRESTECVHGFLETTTGNPNRSGIELTFVHGFLETTTGNPN